MKQIAIEAQKAKSEGVSESILSRVADKITTDPAVLREQELRNDLPYVLDMWQIREAVESGLTTETHLLLFANGAFTAKRKALQKQIPILICIKMIKSRNDL